MRTLGSAWMLSLLLAGTAGAEIKVSTPEVFRPGAVNVVSLSVEGSFLPFTVQAVRPGSPRPVASAHGFLREAGTAVALVCFEPLEVPGPIRLRFVGADGVLWGEVESRIGTRDFPTVDLPLDRTMSALRAQPHPRKDREAAELWAILKRFHPANGAPEAFTIPVESSARVSAGFGQIRQYRYADGTTARDYHRGVDFSLPEGTAISAPAPGKTVQVADRMLTGHTIVLEHGPGIYSVYFHLSRASVAVGQTVAQGERIGLSGATGLVTGPHLHWELRIEGVPVDPLEVVASGILDMTSSNRVVSSIERPIH